MRKIVRFLLLFVIIWLFSVSALWANQEEFENVKIQIDNLEQMNYALERAIIYRNVSITYDSTILIQSSESSQILFIPQLGKGKGNILRIILGDITKREKLSYDVYFLLGDEIPDTLLWGDEDNKIYMCINSIANTYVLQSKKINGHIIFTRDNKGNVVKGEVGVKFEIVSSNEQERIRQFNLDGLFTLAVGDYLDISLEKSISEMKRKNVRYRNILIGVFAAIFVVTIYLLR